MERPQVLLTGKWRAAVERHLAPDVLTDATADIAMGMRVVENLDAFFAGKVPPDVVA